MHKVAIITGASRGIGRAAALYFAKQGYHVALLARSETPLITLKQEIETQSHAAMSASSANNSLVSIYPVDVSVEAQVQTAIADIIQAQGRIDVLFNNAGIVTQGTSDLASDAFEKMLAVNTLGAFYLIQSVSAQMKLQHTGYIFNLASHSGKRAISHSGGYAASKFALIGMNEALYRELLPQGIRVTALCPGYVNTDMTQGASIDANDMIQTDDIVTTIDYLLRLNDNICIKEIIIECKAQVIRDCL